MGGSIAQEMGHDLTIMYFFHKVVRPIGRKEDFFIVHPAMGPKRDVHYWNQKHDEYTSGWNTSGDENFPPQWLFRRTLSHEELARLDAQSRYRHERWYHTLSACLREDLMLFTDGLFGIERTIAEHYPQVDKLPDFVGVREGRVASIGEIKFEYLPKGALKEFLAYHAVAQQFGVPFYLIFPRKGYTRTDYNWLKNNVPPDTQFYAFEGAELKPIIVPNLRDIKFERWFPK